MRISRHTKKKLWLLGILLFLLPGFRLWPMLLGMTPAGFLPALALHNAYYALPRALFGTDDYPVEEFGILPTTKGYGIAALLYAIVALLIFAVVCIIMNLTRTGTANQRLQFTFLPRRQKRN